MSTASGPEPGADEFACCELCGRTLLRGEQLHDYVDPESKAVGVCVLCKPAAEAAGWIPISQMGARRPEPAARRGRRLRLREWLAQRGAAEALSETADPPEPEPVPQPAAAEPPPDPPTPLETFNASDEPRKIAGLVRSLGEPQATIRPVAQGGLVTVAWELSWYQWRVSGGEVSEVAKGGELSELAAEDREWNASVAEDGQLVLG